MSPEFIPSHDSLIPPQELPPGADAFARQMQSLLDGHPKEEAAVASAFDCAVRSCPSCVRASSASATWPNDSRTTS